MALISKTQTDISQEEFSSGIPKVKKIHLFVNAAAQVEIRELLIS